MILPSRFHSFLTNRSRSRSTSGQARGQTPSVNRQRKGYSLFPMPSVSDHGKSGYGVTTDISTSSWTRSQAETVQDIEQGPTSAKEQPSVSRNPIRVLFPSKSRSFQTSLWSSVDRAGSPPLQSRSMHPPHMTGFQAMASRTEVAEKTGKASVDEQVELLQVPENSYRVGEYFRNEDNITALPRTGVPLDQSPPKWT